MRKLSVVLFSLIFCGYCFAEVPENNEEPKDNDEYKEFQISVDFMNLGVGMSYNDVNNFVPSLDLYLFHFNIENATTGLGIEFIPFNYSTLLSLRENSLSLAKLYIYLNMFKLFTGIEQIQRNKADIGIHCILGPFFSMQTLYINDITNISNISYSAGIRLSFKGFLTDYLSIFPAYIETGYNYYNGRHGFFLNMNLAVATCLALAPIYLLMVLVLGNQ
jgi:hypothetical protein